MRKAMIMGNWKMHMRLPEAIELFQSLLVAKSYHNDVECCVFPPAIHLHKAQELLQHSPVKWGAQNVYPMDAGAFTGELSGPMLVDYGCRYVLVGHSERRHFFHEDEKFISEKFHHVKERGMIPVLCVGETLEQRQRDLTEQVIYEQLMTIAANGGKQTFDNAVIAYEPVWAIGTGHTATPEQAQTVHASIRKLIATYNEDIASRISILYGGSVNEKNARALFAESDIDGGLVGGASLNARQFVEIIECIK